MMKLFLRLNVCLALLISFMLSANTYAGQYNNQYTKPVSQSMPHGKILLAIWGQGSGQHTPNKKEEACIKARNKERVQCQKKYWSNEPSADNSKYFKCAKDSETNFKKCLGPTH